MFIDYVALLNDTIKVDSGTSISDWCAIFALLFSIGTLIWQGILRGQDKQEQLERIQKEDKIRQWNALYPHRLDFYTNFYDSLYRFVKYAPVIEKCGKASLSGNIEQKTINTIELCEYCSLFNRYAEEAKILFNKDISGRVHKVYEIVERFINQPFYDSGETMQYLDEEVKSTGRTREYYYDLERSLLNTQNSINELKWDTDLREKFMKVLKLEGNKDE